MDQVAALAATTASHRAAIVRLFTPYMEELLKFVPPRDREAATERTLKNLDRYWKDGSRHPYLFCEGTTPCGFGLVYCRTVADKELCSVAEFYIHPDFRQHGYGKSAATKLIYRHGPDWEITVLGSNVAADVFWGRLVSRISKGNERRFLRRGEDGTERIVYQFSVPAR